MLGLEAFTEMYQITKIDKYLDFTLALSNKYQFQKDGF